MNADKSLKLAQENYNRMISNIPEQLLNDEDDIFRKLSKMQSSPEKKLIILYDLLHELHGYISKYTPCKKGCSGCCYYTVSISDIEIKYIEQRESKKPIKHYGKSRNFHGEPCPFLLSGACSIYESRPFFCRKHVALTETAFWCSPDCCNDYNFPLLIFSEIQKSFDLIRAESSSLAVYDIRQVFV